MAGRLIDGRALARPILAEARRAVAGAGGAEAMGRLVSVSIGYRPEVALYLRNQARGASEVGLRFDQLLWSADISQNAAEGLIQEMNDDPQVLGIVVQRPVPKELDLCRLQSAIAPAKDVEGMNPASIGAIAFGEGRLLPCTAAAVVELISASGAALEGLEVVMVGQDELVARPVAFLLMAGGASVTVCGDAAPMLARHLKRADVVVVATGTPGVVRADMIRPGATVIDIGLHLVPAPGGGARLRGDVDTEEMLTTAGRVAPVPGGVGPVTVAMLMRNATLAHRLACGDTG